MDAKQEAMLACNLIAKGVPTELSVRDLDVLHNELLCLELDRFEVDFNKIFGDNNDQVKD